MNEQEKQYVQKFVEKYNTLIDDVYNQLLANKYISDIDIDGVNDSVKSITLSDKVVPAIHLLVIAQRLTTLNQYINTRAMIKNGVYYSISATQVEFYNETLLLIGE